MSSTIEIHKLANYFHQVINGEILPAYQYHVGHRLFYLFDLKLGKPRLSRQTIDLTLKLILCLDDEDSMPGWDHTRYLPIKRTTVLVFLPSLLEIERVDESLRFPREKANSTKFNVDDYDQCKKFNYHIIPLHSDLSMDDQVNIFTPAKTTYRKLGALTILMGQDKIRPFDADLTFGNILALLPIHIELSGLIALGHVFGLVYEIIVTAARLSTKSIFKISYKDRLAVKKSTFYFAADTFCDCHGFLNIDKLIIDRAFFPNYYIRQPNESEAIDRELSSKDPLRTIMIILQTFERSAALQRVKRVRLYMSAGKIQNEILNHQRDLFPEEHLYASPHVSK
ncbi:unnamed protein product [Rotaria sordida]|uniref:Uncharacterized protein n=1 Tax=Rotaria sordida TaxID=392033 RepID=A0A815MMD7_9BILA|nr:unnamed protein product [Rotaria sordida]CAF1422575.1 unnamed protein product [Rotaria sordida]